MTLLSSISSQQDAPPSPEAAAPPPRLSSRVKRSVLQGAARLMPHRVADMLARRYLCSSHGFLDEIADRKNRFDVVRLSETVALLRHRSKGHEAPTRRVLIVPGHDGHYRQFTRIVRSLTQQGCAVDLLVLPGHMHVDQTVCSMRDMVEAIQTAFESGTAYDGMIAHCVTSNAALFALDQGVRCDQVVLMSTPLDLPRLVRFGGAQYGLDSRCLDLFVQSVSALGAPYHLDTPWRPILAERSEDILVMHARDDYAAPVEDVRAFSSLCPTAELAIFDHSGHNAILNTKAAVARIGDFFS